MMVDMENNDLTKQNEQFRILTARQHVRERIGMYMGSSSKEEFKRGDRKIHPWRMEESHVCTCTIKNGRRDSRQLN